MNSIYRYHYKKSIPHNLEKKILTNTNLTYS